MSGLLRRRMMMARATVPAPITLVNGTYASGKLDVTNGNTLSLSSPSQWVNILIPITKTLSVNANDTISFCLVSLTAGKNMTFGITRQSKTNIPIVSATKPVKGQWYTVTIDEDSVISGVYYQPREVNDTRTIVISLMHNSDVLF